MSDYAATTPLWVDGGNLVDLAALQLPPHLESALLAWQRHFDAHHRADRSPSWDDGAAARWYLAEGRRLHDRLSRALPEMDVSVDLWPVATGHLD